MNKNRFKLEKFNFLKDFLELKDRILFKYF